MKDYLSFFLLRNTIAAKMKKNISNFCNGAGSTSTLNQGRYGVDPQYQLSSQISPSMVSSCSPSGGHQTLEEMILRLELEEEAAKKAKLKEESSRRMSCVNNSDILRSARNALNQYPRFSLDGRDAMYRSSFRNMECNGVEMRRRSVCSYEQGLSLGRRLGLPPTLAGEKVVWCKPGVVPKLMGLDAVPVPIGGGRTTGNGRRCRAEKDEFIRHERQRRLDRKVDPKSQQRWRSDYHEIEPATRNHRWEMH